MEYDYSDDFEGAYQKVSKRKQSADEWIERLRNEDLETKPVRPVHSLKLVESFWAKSWCQHIHNFKDQEFRLESGRSILRAGAILDLRIAPSRIAAKVLDGRQIFEVSMKFAEIQHEKLTRMLSQFSQESAEVIDLLSGQLSPQLLKILIHPTEGIFPLAGEISHQCNCLDTADFCKHKAAVAYGIGIRFDDDPSLFFTLRNIDPAVLIRGGAEQLNTEFSAMSEDEAQNIFDIEFDNDLR
jgi:uncharacterized Zn finger protein